MLYSKLVLYNSFMKNLKASNPSLFFFSFFSFRPSPVVQLVTSKPSHVGMGVRISMLHELVFFLTKIKYKYK